MRQNAPSIHPTSLIEQPDVPVVLSKFQVDGYQFFIVSLENNSDTKFSWDEPTDQSKIYAEVDRFQVRGQLCAIVKVEQISSVEIDLTTLLTERELKIATLVASGQVNKQIANQLCISEWTVSTHLRRIFIKLGVDSRAAMVYRCASIIKNCSEKLI
jgi:DNA-binding NarL/FixJ family response regulator